MGKPTGFLEEPRFNPQRRPVSIRTRDWNEVYVPQDADVTRAQAGRCMDCGIPFCHQGCPLGNLIPEWNDLVYRDDWEGALARLSATNNFPEFTGRLCPAPCESACVVAISDQAVTIERVEYEIAERGFAEGWVHPHVSKPNGLSVAVVGSGPSGLAAAQQLARQGYSVEVIERADKIGGLLRYGIPEFKMEKRILDRRLDQMRAEGVSFTVNHEVTSKALRDLRDQHDAVILAIGSTRPRIVDFPGNDASGVHSAMAYLSAEQQGIEGFDAQGRHVVILGGGDTGADCLGTALRQGALSVTQLEILAQPPATRPDSQPWPIMPSIYKVTSAHEEGGERVFSAHTTRADVDEYGNVFQLVFASGNGSETFIPASMILIAAGFVGPEVDGLIEDGLVNSRGNIMVDDEWLIESNGDHAPLFGCGDAVRGQSLIVWAIAEGRSAAAAVDATLRGHSNLPQPVRPGQLSWGT